MESSAFPGWWLTGKTLKGQSYPKPSISVVPSKIVPLGGNATIRCKVRSEDYAQATFVLFRELDSSLHASVVKKSEWNEVAFFFANVKLSDGGNYRCRYCFNSFSGDSCSPLSDRVKVKIRDPSLSKPSIGMRPGDPLAEGFNVTIECHGPENGLNFSLHKSSNLIAWQMAESDGNTSEFSLSMIRLEDEGNYTCQYHRRGHAFLWSEPSDAVRLELVTANTFTSMEINIRLGVAGLVLLSLVLIVAEFMCSRQG
ncbi:immunoglobulin superfamily member 1-like [Podarcis lilfordi]|nr:immunoglobulin superfamily member 1-like [Podarcis lilfordi]